MMAPQAPLQNKINATRIRLGIYPGSHIAATEAPPARFPLRAYCKFDERSSLVEFLGWQIPARRAERFWCSIGAVQCCQSVAASGPAVSRPACCGAAGYARSDGRRRGTQRGRHPQSFEGDGGTDVGAGFRRRFLQVEARRSGSPMHHPTGAERSSSRTASRQRGRVPVGKKLFH